MYILLFFTFSNGRIIPKLSNSTSITPEKTLSIRSTNAKNWAKKLMDYWTFKQKQTARDKRMNEVNIQVTATYGSKWDINNVNKLPLLKYIYIIFLILKILFLSTKVTCVSRGFFMILNLDTKRRILMMLIIRKLP